MSTAYFDTTHLSQLELPLAQAIALKQEEKVAAIFRLWGKPMSPSMVYFYGRDHNRETWLLTSVRRSISTLTDAGKLVKTDVKVAGPYGRPEYQWKLP